MNKFLSFLFTQDSRRFRRLAQPESEDRRLAKPETNFSFYGSGLFTRTPTHAYKYV